MGLLFTLITSCASTGSGTDYLSLQEAIEQSAEKIANELPTGSRVAIVAFNSENENLSDYIMAEFSSALFNKGLEVADRQNLEFVYKELNFNMSGNVSDETAQSIGKMLGAQLVITGSLTSLGGSYRYRTNVIHVERATLASDTRFTVRNDHEMKIMVAALASQTSFTRRVEYGQEEQTKPVSAGNFLDRGLLFASRGDYDMAITDFTDALVINPNLTAAYYNRGLAYHNKKDFDNAIEDYSQALRLNPNDAVIYMYRGFSQSHNKNYDRAIADYTQAIRLDQNYADAYFNRGNAYFAKCKNDWEEIISTADYDRAITDYTQAIRLDVSSAWRYAARGNAYLANGFNNQYRDNNRATIDFNRAILDFDQAIRLGPTAWRYTERGQAYLGKNDYDKAISDFSKAIELEPATWRYNLLGNAYLRKGDYANAIRIYSNDTKMYRILFGDIREDEIIRFDKLRELGFTLYYEGSEYHSPGRRLRPIISGIRGTDIPITFQKIFSHGFRNFWIREGN